jgi:hypothetical protein
MLKMADSVSKLRPPTDLLLIPRYVGMKNHGGMILTGKIEELR